MIGTLDALPPSLRRRVEAELQPGERVLWAGMPSPLSALLPSLFLFVFGIGWSSLTFTWEAVAVRALLGGASSDKAPGMPGGMGVMFALFGIPFVLVGIALLGAPFFVALQAMMTAHVVTDRRLLTVTGGPWKQVESRDPGALTFLRRRDHRNGRGTLRLGFGTTRDSDGDARSVETSWAGVAEVRQAEEAVRELARSVGRKV
ncbi:MAG: hypothetical protein U1E62_18190 [Alsobacter sp.]